MFVLAQSASSLVLASASLMDGFSRQQQVAVAQLVDQATEHIGTTTNERADYHTGTQSIATVDGVEVAPNHFHVASYDVPLGTGNLSACSALAILYPRNRRHYLAHVMPLSGDAHLLKTVRGSFTRVRPANLEIYVLPGAVAGRSAGVIASLTNIYSLLTFMGWEQQAQLVLPQPTKPFAGLIIHEGEVFNHSLALPRSSPPQNLINRRYNNLNNPLINPLDDP